MLHKVSPLTQIHSLNHANLGWFDTEYDRANVPPYNGNDPPPAPGSLKRSLFPPLLNEVQNKGTQGVRARYGAELPPIISIVRYPGRPVISVPDWCLKAHAKCGNRFPSIFCGEYGDENRTPTFFLKLFGHPRDIPPKSLVSLGLEG